jgi:hypothetical protein
MFNKHDEMAHSFNGSWSSYPWNDNYPRTINSIHCGTSELSVSRIGTIRGTVLDTNNKRMFLGRSQNQWCLSQLIHWEILYRLIDSHGLDLSNLRTVERVVKSRNPIQSLTSMVFFLMHGI